MENTQNSEFDPHDLKANIGRAGLTVSAVCDESGITPATFSNWMKGIKPQQSKLDQFNKAFEKLKGQKK